MRSWLPSGILTNTKNIVRLPRASFMTSLRPSKFYQTGIRDPTMTSCWSSNTRWKTLTQLSTASSMSMASSMSPRRNSSMNIIQAPSVTTTLSLGFPKLPLLMTSRRHTGNLPSNTILRAILEMNKLTKSSLRWMKPIMLCQMSSKSKTMTTFFSERLLL